MLLPLIWGGARGSLSGNDSVELLRPDWSMVESFSLHNSCSRLDLIQDPIPPCSVELLQGEAMVISGGTDEESASSVARGGTWVPGTVPNASAIAAAAEATPTNLAPGYTDTGADVAVSGRHMATTQVMSSTWPKGRSELDRARAARLAAKELRISRTCLSLGASPSLPLPATWQSSLIAGHSRNIPAISLLDTQSPKPSDPITTKSPGSIRISNRAALLGRSPHPS
mmetsp:Transcript_4937/g.9262  ORF Transcript_4937/g.9262 Transcript_4937/m.9262 type:complete len:227 (-) Transcript_4937:421-1101(-)